MPDPIGPYVGKVMARMIGVALAAVAGATIAGMVLAVPVALLGETGIIAYRIEKHDEAIWVLAILGGLWGIAHMMESIVRSTAHEPTQTRRIRLDPQTLAQFPPDAMTTYRETYRGYEIFSLGLQDFQVSSSDGVLVATTKSLPLAKQAVDGIEAAEQQPADASAPEPQSYRGYLIRSDGNLFNLVWKDGRTIVQTESQALAKQAIDEIVTADGESE